MTHFLILKFYFTPSEMGFAGNNFYQKCIYQLTKNIFSGFKTYMNIQSYNPSFQANINSRKLNFNRADFYVRIRGYGKDADWARKIVETADVAVKMIRKDTFIENILRDIVLINE